MNHKANVSKKKGVRSRARKAIPTKITTLRINKFLTIGDNLILNI
ncbi:hypothetical protein DDD_2787 [Nonlabens dokdonensis DSW-6]|uniref:Uncharacterized protein n=1 Tax=Nonlabens dokdonensis (strain DSM 17205 / KCTC 12402 / DSW-6) TaxID=592029 RepID=L7WCV7_NONDD|nr:hypothetical protein DDD_2787 [Nonlabens dokdonensis DSW-6]